MTARNFEELQVWQKGHRMVLNIYKITKSFPEEEKFGLISQIRRSGVSICANIAEGYKKSTKDFIRYLEISEGSLEETKYHLILSKDLEYCTSSQFKELYEKAEEVGKMLNGLINRLRF